MAADWLTRLGRKGFETLVDDVVQQSVDRGLRDRVEPRLASIENRLVAIETMLCGGQTIQIGGRSLSLEGIEIVESGLDSAGIRTA